MIGEGARESVVARAATVLDESSTWSRHLHRPRAPNATPHRPDWARTQQTTDARPKLRLGPAACLCGWAAGGTGPPTARK